MPPSGVGYLIVPAPGAVVDPDRETSLQADGYFDKAVATRMLALWARTVISSAHSYWQAAMKAAWIDRAIDYAEDWSPTEVDLGVALNEVWVRGYHLVMTVYQMETWQQAYRKGTGFAEEPPEILRALRNSLEHLDGASFSAYYAKKREARGKNKEPGAKSIDYLPGQELFLGFSGDFTEAAFGLVDLKDVTERAREFMHLDEPDEPDYDNSDAHDDM